MNASDKWGLLLLGAAALLVVLIGIFVSYRPFDMFFETPVVTDVACTGECATAGLDLVTQQSTALATWVATFASVTSLIVTAVTLYLVAENLKEARRISREAARASTAAEEAVDVMAQTNATTAELGRAQVRAYVTIVGIEGEVEDPGHVRLTFNYANTGQSPARDLALRLKVIHGMQVGHDWGGTWHHLNPVPGNAYMNDQPGGAMDGTTSWSMNTDAYSAPFESVFRRDPEDDEATTIVADRIIIKGLIEYRDVFDIKHADPFEFLATIPRKDRASLTTFTMQRRPT